MPNILVWQHPREKERIFMTKAEYLSELKEEAWYDFCLKKSNIIEAHFNSLIFKERNNVKNVSDMLAFISKNFTMAFEYACWMENFSPKKYMCCVKEIYLGEAWATVSNRDSEKPITFYDLHFSISIREEDSFEETNYRLANHMRRVIGFKTAVGGRHVMSGDWHLLNQPAEWHYAKQKEEWRAKAVVDALMNEDRKPFKFEDVTLGR